MVVLEDHPRPPAPHGGQEGDTVPDLYNGVTWTVSAADLSKDSGWENPVPAGSTDYSVSVSNVIRRESRYHRGSCCHLQPGRRPPPHHLVGVQF